MPPKRKAFASSAQNSLSQPPKRSRKASPTSPFPCPKRTSTALPSQPSTPLRATRSSARRAALSSLKAPFSSPTLAHVAAPASLEEESRLSSPEIDGRPSVMPVQPDILTLKLDELQESKRDYEKRTGNLEDGNAGVKEKNKKMVAILNLPGTQIAGNENKTDTALQDKLSLANAQHTKDIAIINQLEKKIAELEETNRSLRANTSKPRSTDENQYPEADSDEQVNISTTDNSALWERITELDIERKEARQEVKELSRKVEELEERIKIGTKELAELQEELTECEDELERAEKELDTTKNEKANAEARLADALVELQNVNGLADELMKSQKGWRLAKFELGKVQRAEKETMRKMISKQKDLDDTLKDNQELEAKLEVVISSLEEKANQIAQLEARYANAISCLEGANQETTAMKAGLAASQKQMAELEKERAELEKDIEKHKNLSEHLQEAADGHLKTKRHLEKMVGNLTAEVVKMRERPQTSWNEKQEGRSAKIGLGLDWE